MEGTFIFTLEILLWYINDNGERRIEQSNIKIVASFFEYYIETFLGFLESHHQAM